MSKCTLSIEEARDIMGCDNFFGPGDWLRCFALALTPIQQMQVSEFPCSREVLESPCEFFPSKRVYETHYAFLGRENINSHRPLTIAYWRKNPADYFYGQEPDRLFPLEKFSVIETCAFRWYLALRDVVPQSNNLSWERMTKILAEHPNYHGAKAIVEVTKKILFSQKNLCKCPELSYVACESMDFDGERVVVGGFQGKIYVSNWMNNPLANIHLGVYRRLGV